MDVDERTPEAQADWIATHDGNPYAGLVAEVGEAVVGYASLSPINPRPGYRPTVENSLYVHPDWQGRGVGRKLLAALIESAVAGGFRNIVALISADNEASLRVHRAQGFVDAGLLKAVGYKHGRWVDVAYLQLALDAAEEVT